MIGVKMTDENLYVKGGNSRLFDSCHSNIKESDIEEVSVLRRSVMVDEI